MRTSTTATAVLTCHKETVYYIQLLTKKIKYDFIFVFSCSTAKENLHRKSDGSVWMVNGGRGV
jgi:hypothetical protein